MVVLTTTQFWIVVALALASGGMAVGGIILIHRS